MYVRMYIRHTKIGVGSWHMHTGIVHTCIHTYIHACICTYIHTKMTTLHNYQRLTKAPGNHIPRPKLSDLIGLFIATECNRQKKNK